ncbi:hypothetical protein PoB_001717900 [Plakobranchus ocellatus]|uniref:Uncharacterized protein n=1 Tax=Plakobranchus ocellatus TaxID=259542 RepID=A0AAV3Z5T5_9GAST|nr:hypothetical protein PoB_001717900 [Plakobranchus ocellatus]
MAECENVTPLASCAFDPITSTDDDHLSFSSHQAGSSLHLYSPGRAKLYKTGKKFGAEVELFVNKHNAPHAAPSENNLRGRVDFLTALYQFEWRFVCVCTVRTVLAAAMLEVAGPRKRRGCQATAVRYYGLDLYANAAANAVRLLEDRTRSGRQIKGREGKRSELERSAP